MSGKNFITVESLVTSSQGASKEKVFDLAHATLDSLERPIKRLYDLKALADSFQRNPETAHVGPGPDVFVENYAALVDDVNELVDEPLFHDEAFEQTRQFDDFLREMTERVNADMSLLEEFVVSALGELPDQIPSAQGRSSGKMHQERASCYGTSRLPSLASSFDEVSQADVKKLAQGIVQALRRQLARVKDLALLQIARGQGNFYTWGFQELYGIAEGLAPLFRYVKISQRDSQTITKFMAGNLDRAAARFECQMKALMIAHSDIQMDRVPTERRSLYEVLQRCNRCHDTVSQRLGERNRWLEWLKNQGDPDTFKLWADRLDIVAISKRLEELKNLQGKVQSMAEPGDKILGESFFINALGILYRLLKDDDWSLEKLNWELKKLQK
ncbi:hypothetical protein N0V84_004915 [Fusarium piperis]|uniref:Uncharacterized protein n=1 Tax=Fusarium piperis TaxID=1435070 RepID=A0A9W9BQQ2_9HYPO|nr:hypothetical protein N0V84_004915 [Fusarium piperis]